MGANDYLVGQARVFFNDGNGFLDLGNIPNFSMQRNVTTLDHFTVKDGVRQKDLTIITEASIGFSFSIDEFSAENLNLIMFGSGVTAANQSSGSAVSEVVNAPAILDRSVFLAFTNVSSVVVKDVTDTTTYVEGTDYEIVNATTGELKILSGGSISVSDELHISYDYAARNRSKIVPGKDFRINGSARLEIQTITGQDITWKINSAEIRVEGDSVLEDANWSASSLILDVTVDKTTTPSEPLGAMFAG